MDLDIAGHAKDGEAVLVFLESLFAHSAFAEPVLLNEVKQSPQLVRFNLQTRYRIGGVPEGERASPASGSDAEPVAALDGDGLSSDEERTGGTEHGLDSEAASVEGDGATTPPAERAR